jgi:hypothetical protein
MINEQQLSNLIKLALDSESDVQVNPAEARQRMADKIAQAVALFVIGRITLVTGTSATGGPITGTGIIQGN